jgi:hypothetical protein
VLPDDSFDVVWMQNVGMNIADKRTLSGRTSAPAVPGPLAVAVFVDNLAQKAGNARRRIEEGGRPCSQR